MYVSREATLTNQPWLEEGFRLWADEPTFNFPRDFFLPLPRSDLSGCVKREATYTDMAALCRTLLIDLQEVMWDAGTWTQLDSPLFTTSDAVSFWKLHGLRNFLKSLSLLLDVPPWKSDYLGRWKASSSDEYIRTAKQVTLGLQTQIALEIRKCPFRVDESSTMDDLANFLRQAGLEEADIATQRVKLMPSVTSPNFTAPATPAGPGLTAEADHSSDDDFGQ